MDNDVEGSLVSEEGRGFAIKNMEIWHILFVIYEVDTWYIILFAFDSWFHDTGQFGNNNVQKYRKFNFNCIFRKMQFCDIAAEISQEVLGYFS